MVKTTSWFTGTGDGNVPGVATFLEACFRRTISSQSLLQTFIYLAVVLLTATRCLCWRVCVGKNGSILSLVLSLSNPKAWTETV
uniref:Uncharacterized protein n=1 Tax=Oryza meridionalis TaxID=40149 RepID=A0A0E0C9J3_9ORYZ